MGRIASLMGIAAVLVLAASCHNPLLDKVMATVALKDLHPTISVSTEAGSIAPGKSFGFGTISINTSKEVTFTIENTGTAPLSLTDTPKVSIAGPDATLFAVASEPTTPIKAGSSTTFVLRFSPTTEGAKSATVTIPNNDTANGSFTFTVTGTGSIQASIQLLQGSTDIAIGSGIYSFPQTGLTYSSADVTFTIKNNGTAALSLTGTPVVQVGGDFSVASQPASTTIAAGGGTTSFTMHFMPSSEGARTATVTIANNDPNSATFTFTVQGMASTVMLAKTGQTTPYLAGDDGTDQVGVAWPSPRFAASGNTITDGLTGLTWTKGANLINTNFPSQNWDNDGTQDDGMVTWQHALDFVHHLSDINYESQSHWRLPNRNELRSLINLEELDNSTFLAAAGFTAVQSTNYYWTSTTYSPDDTQAWYVDVYYTGECWNAAKSTEFFVWAVSDSSTPSPVRLPATGQTAPYDTNPSGPADDGSLGKGAPWPTPRFVEDTPSTVLDKLTGLIWQKEPSPVLFLWQDALGEASGAATGGYTDWRLPNLNELAGLLNAGVSSTAANLNTLGFSSVQETTPYWTSSTVRSNTGRAWVVNLGDGFIRPNVSKSSTRYVWLVRSSS